ncbi:hypothetical protein JCM17961_40200 [Endothiovibrio diazotrophicus]
MSTDIDTREALGAFTREHPIAVTWFSGPDCNVCHALRPKVEALLAEEFPRVPLAAVDCDRARDLAAQLGVFTIPTAVIWIDGREAQRFARNFSPGELRAALARPYALCFE